MKEQVQTNPAAGSEMAAKKTQHQKIVAMVQIALFAAIIAVCSWIQIPMTVPFTMQTFAVFCALATLGGKGGTISVLIYIVLGAVGVPVFAGFTGGVGILFGTTGGYIIGFLFTGLLYWLITHFLGDKLPVMILALVLGLAVCYAFGTAWFMIVYAKNSGSVGLLTALLVRIPVHSAGLRKDGAGDPHCKAPPETADPACISCVPTTGCVPPFSAVTATVMLSPQT